MPASERARARSVVGPGASASDRFEVRRAMALESLVEASHLEVVDRVGPVSVVPPKLDDWNPALTCESVHVAWWYLPTPGQLLGSQQLGTRDAAQGILYDAMTHLASRGTCRPQACRAAVGAHSARGSDRRSPLPFGSMRGGTYESGSGIRLKILKVSATLKYCKRS